MFLHRHHFLKAHVAYRSSYWQLGTASRMKLPLLLLGLLALRQSLAYTVFSPVPFQFSSTSKHQAQSSRSVVSGFDSTVLTSNSPNVEGGYKVIGRAGAGLPWGQVYDKDNKPVFKLDKERRKTSEEDASVSPDSMTILNRKGNGEGYLVLHFESPAPASIAIAKVKQDKKTGELTVTDKQNADFSAWGGLLNPCAGSDSPWGTHLGSEESDPDARVLGEADWTKLPIGIAGTVADHVRYFGLYLSDFKTPEEYWAAAKKVFNPYRYGHITEVLVNGNGKHTTMKWYTMGRASWEMALVMPDHKTVYLADDASRNVGFFKFIADKAGDLRLGTLYAVKVKQTNDKNGGSFDLQWILLGKGQQDMLQKMGENTKFADIFEYAKPNGTICPPGYRGTFSAGSGAECLKLKPGMETAAAFLESRRYASYLGATTEFSKWEGMTYDATRNVVYTALTAVDRGMLKESARITQDDMRLPENRCGCIYTLALDKSYNAVEMNGLLCGEPDIGLVPQFNPNANVSTCNVDNIASPDNVWYVDGQDALLIAEDSEHHENNMLWWYDLKAKQLTRLQTAPYGAEQTGTKVMEWNGYTYILNNIQHPYEDLDGLAAEKEATGKGGYVGYIGPLKRTSTKEKESPAWALSHVAVGRTREDRHKVLASSRVVFGVRDHIDYHILARSGDKAGGVGPVTIGLQIDKDGKPVDNYKQADNYSLPNNRNTSSPAISNSADHISLHGVCDKRYALVHFESPQPATMNVLTLKQDGKAGDLSTIGGQQVDFSAWGGLWVPCAGSTTSWNTRLAGEEYEPNARAAEAATTTAEFAKAGEYPLVDMTRYYGAYYPDIATAKNLVKPYRYGYVFEAKVQYDGSVSVMKHYTTGRLAVELGYMMPDNKTMYITDDGTNVGFFKFVADEQYDLTAGTLYAAKFTQMSAANGGSFKLSWIKLAYGRAEQLLNLPDSLKFSDIFETAAPQNATCPAGFKAVNNQSPPQSGCECIKLKPGRELEAAFFETRRYAAYLGATTEFSKWEGITIDRIRNKLYTSISVVRNGMEDFKAKGKASNTYDDCGANDIRVNYNACGCVYQLDLDSAYSATSMSALVCGIEDSSIEKNTCYYNGIAEPDNLSFMEGHDQLLIGEDTSGHQNDVMWVYDMTTKSLARVFGTPYGSETTSTYWYPKLGGHAYIMATVQHPYGETDQDKLTEAGSFGIHSASGAIGPLTPPYNARDAVDSCNDQVFVLSTDVVVTGKVKYADIKPRIAQFMQYKVERVLANWAGVHPGADNVMSTVSWSSSGSNDVLTVHVRLLLDTKHNKGVMKVDDKSDSIEQVATPLVDNSSVKLARTTARPAKRLGALNMNASL